MEEGQDWSQEREIQTFYFETDSTFSSTTSRGVVDHTP